MSVMTKLFVVLLIICSLLLTAATVVFVNRTEDFHKAANASEERALRFHRAVQGLSEQQRHCLFLRLEGLRYPEIGSALGIGASTVGEFLRRALPVYEAERALA